MYIWCGSTYTIFSKGQNIELKRILVVTVIIKSCRDREGMQRGFFLERCVMILVVVQEPIYVIKLHRASYQNQRAHIKTDV